jgi:hypothetical protein
MSPLRDDRRRTSDTYAVFPSKVSETDTAAHTSEEHTAAPDLQRGGAGASQGLAAAANKPFLFLGLGLQRSMLLSVHPPPKPFSAFATIHQAQISIALRLLSDDMIGVFAKWCIGD